MKNFIKYIIYITYEKKTQERVIESSEFSIGRSVDLQITLSDPNVSRKHLSVIEENGSVYIIDEASANGTYLNQKKIKSGQKVRILPTDLILVGNSGFELRIDPIWETINKTDEQKKLIHSKHDIKESQISALEELKVSAVENLNKPDIESADRKSSELIQINQLQNQISDLKTEIENHLAVKNLLKKEELEIKLTLDKIINEKSALEIDFDQIINQIKLAQNKLKDIEDATEKAKIEESIQKERLQDIINFEEKKLLKELQRQKELQEIKIQEDLHTLFNDKKVAQYELNEIKAKLQIYKEDEVNWTTKEAAFKAEQINIQDKVKQLLDEKETLAIELNSFKKESSNVNSELMSKKIELDNLLIKIADSSTKLNTLVTEIQIESSKKNEFELELAKNKKLNQNLISEIASLTEEKHQLLDQISNYRQNKSELEDRISNYQREANQKQEEYQKKIDQNQLNILSLKTQHEQKMNELKQKFQIEIDYYESTKKNEIELQIKNEVRRLNQYRQELIENIEKSLIQLIIPYLETAHQKSVFSGMVKILNENINFILTKNELAIDTKKIEISQFDPLKLNSRPFWKPLISGIAIGLLITLAIFPLIIPNKKINTSNDTTTASTSIITEAQFLPEQTDLWYENLTNLVIYNKHFSHWYLNPDYQSELNSFVIAQMFKLWRTEEEITVKALSQTYSLINDLEQKRLNINPDFVKQNIAKMNLLEEETQTQIEKLLGSRIRYESFLKIQKEFYNSRLSKLKLAEQN